MLDLERRIYEKDLADLTQQLDIMHVKHDDMTERFKQEIERYEWEQHYNRILRRALEAIALWGGDEDGEIAKIKNVARETLKREQRAREEDAKGGK